MSRWRDNKIIVDGCTLEQLREFVNDTTAIMHMFRIYAFVFGERQIVRPTPVIVPNTTTIIQPVRYIPEKVIMEPTYSEVVGQKYVVQPQQLVVGQTVPSVHREESVAFEELVVWLAVSSKDNLAKHEIPVGKSEYLYTVEVMKQITKVMGHPSFELNQQQVDKHLIPRLVEPRKLGAGLYWFSAMHDPSDFGKYGG